MHLLFMLPVFAKFLAQLSDPTTALVHLLIASLAGVLVTEGIKGLANQTGHDLSGGAAAITAAVTTALIVFLDPLLAMVPAGADAGVAALVGVALAVLGAFGVHRQLRRVGPAAGAKAK